MEDPDNIASLRNKIRQSALETGLYGRDDEATIANLCRLVQLLENALEDESADQVCLLNEIAEIYKRIALSKLIEHRLVHAGVDHMGSDFSVWLEGLSRESLEKFDDDLCHELAECVLDWAIASKRANNMSDCVYANLIRMKISPIHRISDAVRLLGLSQQNDNHGSSTPEMWTNVTIDPLPTTGGLFQIERRPWRKGRSADESYHASIAARKAGKFVRSIFREHDYTYVNCRSILVSLLSDEEVENAFHPERIFSANMFFRYRIDLATDHVQSEDSNSFDGLHVLARLFLFGLAVNRKLVENGIGRDQFDVLVEAGLVTTSPACTEDVVGEVQVFPIRQQDLFGASNENGRENDVTYLFATDWPLESLRLPRDAVMAVGDDTLELMALSADCTTDSGANQRLLDLCCGCGIQGIFAWCCANPPSSNEGGFNEMVLVDVNDRALHLVVANLALNGVGDGGYRLQDHSKQVHVVRSDLYQALSCSGNTQEGACLDVGTCLTFDVILSNPPFVAIPPNKIHRNPHTAPALYAVGGGVDGTALLERIVHGSFSLRFSLYQQSESLNADRDRSSERRIKLCVDKKLHSWKHGTGVMDSPNSVCRS